MSELLQKSLDGSVKPILEGRIKTSKGREFAFRLRALRNKRCGKGLWHVGLSTSKYFWLDLNTPKLSEAIMLALRLRMRLKTTVWLFKSTKSYWLVTKKRLSREEWNKEYLWWLNAYPNSVVCHDFIVCCLKYKTATLRVDMKNGALPKLLYVFGLERMGLAHTPRSPNPHVFAER